MKKIKRSSWLLAALFISVFSACKPDEDVKVETENFEGVIVVNEGGFGKSNASIGLFKPGTGDYFDAFKKANGRPLGDVIQSITLIDGKFYIVVNNSNKIEVVNKNDFKSVATITVTQPRYILPIGSGKAYISQMNGSSISVLNTGSNAITKTVDVKSSTDNMAVMNGRVYAGKAFGDRLYVINDTTDVVVDSIVLGKGVGSIVKTSSGRIAVLCSGLPGVENGKIAFINEDSAKVERSINLSSGSYSGVMEFYNGNLYYNTGDGKVYSVAATATAPAASASITLASGSVYGMNIDPSNGDRYITDAGDFNSPGKVYIYNSSNNLVRQFTAGIAPSKVLFNK